MSKSKKIVIYTLVMATYVFIMLSLYFNFFISLIIVPFVAWGWATVVLVSFIKDRKRFAADIASDKNSTWTTETTKNAIVWEEEPHDIEWVYETIAMIGFPVMIVFFWVSGLMAR